MKRANVLYHLARDTRTLHRFDKLIWKVTDVTGSQVAGAFAAWFPSLQNFASFDLQGKFVLDSGATMSMGGVDLLQKFREIHADAGPVDFTSRATTSFLLRERSRRRVDECFACSLLALEGDFLYSSVNAPGPMLLGADVHEESGTALSEAFLTACRKQMPNTTALLSQKKKHPHDGRPQRVGSTVKAAKNTRSHADWWKMEKTTRKRAERVSMTEEKQQQGTCKRESES